MISVIVPVYNLENYIERAVNSIRNQTYTELEIILVDDGSKDNSGKILDALAEQDSRIKVIHKENGGVSAARLDGIRAATGDWIGFVDGDDYIEPDMYQRLLQNAMEHDADISHCGYQMVFPNRTDYYYNTGKILIQDANTGVKDLLDGIFVEPGMVIKLYRAGLLREVLRSTSIDSSIRINEDLLLNYYLFKNAAKMVFEDKCFYHYMVRENSASTSVLNQHKLEDPLKVLHLIERDLEDAKLRSIVEGRIIAQLVKLTSIQNKEHFPWIEPYKDHARKELKARLGHIIIGNFSKRQKLQAIWCSVWPWSYGIVHQLYAKVRGLDKKYQV